MQLQHLVIVSTEYPVGKRVLGRTFIRMLAEEVVRQGVRVTVISPEPLISVSTGNQHLKWCERIEQNGVEVLRPGYLSLGSRPLGKRGNTITVTTDLFGLAVRRCLRYLRGPKPELVYGHFFYPAGYGAMVLARRLGIPSVVGLGGSVRGTEEVMPMPPARRARDIHGFTGYLAVSSIFRDVYTEKYGVDPDLFGVFPNAADTRTFYPRDKAQMRRKFGLPGDDFIIVFVGRFEYLKGSRRLEKAMEKVPGVKAVFLGKGVDHPQHPDVLFASPVQHAQVPEYLSAADVFVLPTLVEGSPNAVQEAMACGLPVISSDLPFNTEPLVLDDSRAILVDPHDAEALADAIRSLKDDPSLRAEKARGALEHVENHNIRTRTAKILAWMDEIVRGDGPFRGRAARKRRR